MRKVSAFWSLTPPSSMWRKRLPSSVVDTKRAACCRSCFHTALEILRRVMLRPPRARLSPGRYGSR
eukprot:46503-Pyramimonas_sp.AAC.1